MGIWIRSQDKRELHLVQSFMLNDVKVSTTYITFNYVIVGVTSFGVQYNLGEYETEERALEVLNDIELSLRENHKCFVYQMSAK